MIDHWRRVFFFLLQKQQIFYGYIDSIEEMSGNWIAVQLDAIAMEEFDREDNPSSSEEGFGFLRIVSTSGTLRRMMDDATHLAIGDWVKVCIDPYSKEDGRPEEARPRVWSLQLRDNQFVGDATRKRPVWGRLRSIQRLARASQPEGPRPLGAAVAPSLTTGQTLRRRYSLSNIPVSPMPPECANRWLQRWDSVWQTSTAYALDAGQASFNVVSPSSRRHLTLYFDVGQPLWFHLHTTPANFNPPCFRGGFVILSHWDMDHYAYGYQNPHFHRKHWFAPAQSSVGPCAYRFARKLHAKRRLHLVGTGVSCPDRHSIRIIRCIGNSSNGSGLALHLCTNGRNILLTGDADYNEIPYIQGISLNGLQVPHHGGSLPPQSVIPVAHGMQPRAVISCGLPNRYGHPNNATIMAHQHAGWNVQITAGTPPWLSISMKFLELHQFACQSRRKPLIPVI